MYNVGVVDFSRREELYLYFLIKCVCLFCFVCVYLFVTSFRMRMSSAASLDVGVELFDERALFVGELGRNGDLDGDVMVAANAVIAQTRHTSFSHQ